MYIKKILRPIYHFYKKMLRWYHIKKEVHRLRKIKSFKGNRIFYLGITNHSNLGDMAQYYCIHAWILQNYPAVKLYEFEADVVVDQHFGFVERLKSIWTKSDMIIFQSGYTTQDLGGVHDLMHRLIIENLPDAKILMMPQTIFFQNAENKLKTSKSYNKANNMLFLARDNISYKMAIEMFPDISVKSFPDIVTTLIGQFCFNYERNGILICRRNDGEKFYTEEQISQLKMKLSDLEPVSVSDTTIKKSYRTIRKNLKGFIEGTIADYSKYKLIITDRYHGTIFSLAANTPVIVIKTTDHKVTTGVDWFNGIYDNYVFKADSLEDVVLLTKKVLSYNYDYSLSSYFDREYYWKLRTLFDSSILQR